MTDYLGVSRRNVGAALATGGSALLGRSSSLIVYVDKRSTQQVVNCWLYPLY
jgi:predicted alpha/beta-hydrolase family hydrolase